MHQHSGPLIDRAMAHRGLAFACISYLNTRLDLIPGEHATPDPDKIECLLVKGFSGLDDYAAQFWIGHVLAYVKLTPVDARCAETMKKLQIFATAWKISRSVPQGKDRASQYTKDVSLQDTHPAIREMIEDMMDFWKQSKLHEAASNSYDGEIHSLDDCHIAENIKQYRFNGELITIQLT